MGVRVAQGRPGVGLTVPGEPLQIPIVPLPEVPLYAQTVDMDREEGVAISHMKATRLTPYPEPVVEQEETPRNFLITTVDKLLNPCRADHSVVGVFHKPYLERLAEVLRALGVRRGVVVQGPEGGIVPSVRRKTTVVWADQEGLATEVIDPAALGITHSSEPAMPADSAAIAEGYAAVLDNRPEADPAWRDAACLASGLMLALVRRTSVSEGFERARELLASGAVSQLWERWAEAVRPGVAVER